MTVPSVLNIGGGGAAQNLRAVAVGRVGADGAPPVVKDDLRAQVVGGVLLVIRAPVAIARAVAAVPAAHDVADHMSAAVQMILIILIHRATGIIGIPDAVIGLLAIGTL